MDRSTSTLGRFLWLVLLLVPLAAQAQADTATGQLLFSSIRGYSQKIYVINADGTGEHPLDQRKDQEVDLRVSPDGRTIAYLGQDDKGRSNVYLMDIDGSNPRQLTEFEGCSLAYPGYAWSPDSTQLAISSCNRENVSALVIMTLDGKVKRELPVRGMGIISAVGGWTPDDSALLLSGNVPSARNAFTVDTLFILDLKTSKLHTLTKDISSHDGRLSPDGTRIVYTTLDDANQSAIYTMNVDGSNPELVNLDYSAFKGVRIPIWSPDGTRIAFTGFKINGLIQIMIANVDGTALSQVTNDGRNETGDWLSSGSLTAEATPSP